MKRLPGRRWCPVSQSPSDGPDGVSPWDAFGGDGPGCAPPPGPELTALLGDAAGAIGELDPRQLLGAGSAARRLRAFTDYIEVISVAEFGRQCAARLEASKARGDRVRSRDAEYPAEELGFEMTASPYSAGLLLDMAANIVSRLPATLAGMAAGLIDRDRARVISNATLHLSDDLAAEADKILAERRPGAAPGGPAQEGGPARGPPRPRGRPEAEGRGEARPAGRAAPGGLRRGVAGGAGARPGRGAGGEGVDRRGGGPAPQRGPARHPGPDPGDDPHGPHPPAQPLGPPRTSPRIRAERRLRRHSTATATAATATVPAAVAATQP